MAAKRSAAEASSLPATKKLKTQFEPVKVGPIYSLEEMDIKVLQFQNKKFSERIEQRRKAEEELRKRIEQLEQRQTTDDAVLCIVNRFWNQLDEDVRVLLQRFDAEGADEVEKQNESPAVTSFLNLLSQWDKQETEDKLRQRVEFSERAIGKLLQAYDRVLQRKEKIWNLVKTTTSKSKDDLLDDVKVEEGEGDKEKKSTEKEGQVKDEGSNAKVKEEPVEGQVKSEDAVEAGGITEKDEKVETLSLTEAIRDEMDKLMEDNKRLQNTVTELHQSYRKVTLKNSELQDKVAAAETEVAELKNQVEDLEYHLATANHRVEKLDRHLSETMAKLKTYQEGEIKVQGGGEGVSKDKFNGILTELEEQRDLAATRLSELEKLQEEHQDALKEIEKLKMDLSTLPEEVIIETTEYKCLQSQFSVLYNESMQMKTQLEESRSLLTNSKNAHLRQIEQMELEELAAQKKLRTEMIQMEDGHALVRRECEMLRMEFEQTLAANEQTGPINREMRNLISSLKNHNEQLKAEIQRYKRKLKEAQVEVNKLRQEQQQSSQTTELEPGAASVALSVPSTSQPSSDAPTNSTQTKDARRDLEEVTPVLLKEDDERDIEREREKGKTDIDIIKDLKNELKKAQDKERDMKLLLDMYKCSSKDLREKAQIMASEKKARMELEDVRSQLRRIQDMDRKDKRKMADEEALRKIKKLEETITDLQKSLAAQKQEEETMLSEMEVTGQAFEDMQEQNIRLLQQLREKDDANFKLMSERIKANQLQKILKEEKETFLEQVLTLQHQVDAQNTVVRKLEEKERILVSNLAAVEKELALRQQALEMHKRKAVESAQTAADLKLHLDKYHAQLKEAQQAVAEKTNTLQQQSFKLKRIQEEQATLRKKLDRAKKIEVASSADEVLMEEIREYKEQLTCPSCKVKKKKVPTATLR